MLASQFSHILPSLVSIFPKLNCNYSSLKYEHGGIIEMAAPDAKAVKKLTVTRGCAK